MTITFHKRLLKVLCVAICALCAAIPASALSRSYTVDDLVSGKWVPSEVMYKNYALGFYSNYGFYGYMANDLLTDVRTVGLSLEKVSDNVIKVNGMFGGLLDLPFTWNGKTLDLKANYTLDGDPVYIQYSPANYPSISKVLLSPVDIKDHNGTYFSHYYTSYGWTSDAIKEVSDTKDENGLYDLDISFEQKGVELQITYTSGYSEKFYIDGYALNLFKPNASISDTEIKNGKTTYRNYKGEFEFTGTNSFQMSNLGGREVGVSPVLEYNYIYDYGIYAPTAYFSDVTYFTGTYNLADGTALLNTVPYSASLEGNYTYGNADKQVYSYSVREQTATNTWIENVRGKVRYHGESTNHRGTNFWVTNGGDCTTWTKLEFTFNPWQAVNYTKNEADASVGLIKDTKIVPDKEFEITLDVDVLNDIRVVQADPSHSYLTATVPFVVNKNEHFPVSYEVYVLQGNVSHHSNVDMSKAQLIGSVPYSSAASGSYQVTGTFVPKVNVGAFEVFTDDFTFFVRAIYGTEHHSAPGVRTATALQPTHHDLTTVNFSVTTSVDGIHSDDSDISVERTANGVRVNATSDLTVEIYNAAGALVATGSANSDISVQATGMLLVKAGSNVMKIMR